MPIKALYSRDPRAQGTINVVTSPGASVSVRDSSYHYHHNHYNYYHHHYHHNHYCYCYIVIIPAGIWVLSLVFKKQQRTHSESAAQHPQWILVSCLHDFQSCSAKLNPVYSKITYTDLQQRSPWKWTPRWIKNNSKSHNHPFNRRLGSTPSHIIRDCPQPLQARSLSWDLS